MNTTENTKETECVCNITEGDHPGHIGVQGPGPDYPGHKGTPGEIDLISNYLSLSAHNYMHTSPKPNFYWQQSKSRKTKNKIKAAKKSRKLNRK
jgi:hypothetical protein